ncbi:hypothetical protein [Marinobacter caseinilyticus]|uniref:hypothetical protein n=1 Tax=Marinobacter caseinilyticus TaxID=2692195 RepID=UPI001407CCE6|nr:hypothetical protein [Marinobacter caseinilyticus]
MSEQSQRELDAEVARLQGLMSNLETLQDPAAKSATRELVQVVLRLHHLGLADMLAIVREAGLQPADTLVPRFTANPRVRGLLLLHDLHPDDLATRARNAVERLRPHLGVKGVRAELMGVEDNVVRIRISEDTQKGRTAPVASLRAEIEATVLEMAPDAGGIEIEGLDATRALTLAEPLVWVTSSRAVTK